MRSLLFFFLLSFSLTITAKNKDNKTNKPIQNIQKNLKNIDSHTNYDLREAIKNLTHHEKKNIQQIQSQKTDEQIQNIQKTITNIDSHIKEDIKKIIAQTKDPEILYRVGLNYYKEGDYQKALLFFEAVANKGQLAAQLYLVEIYENGEEGIVQDKRKAVLWLRKALSHKNKTLRKAIRRTMKNILKDLPLSSHDLRKKIIQALEKDQKAFQRLLEYQYVQKHDILTFYRLIRIKKGAGPNPQFHLGEKHEKGDDVPQDNKKALDFFENAALQGHIKACWKLVEIFYEGRADVNIDYDKAIYWLNSLAQREDPRAQLKLGQIYYNGRGILHNNQKAIHWLQKASSNKDSEIQMEARKILELILKDLPSSSNKLIKKIKTFLEMNEKDYQKKPSFSSNKLIKKIKAFLGMNEKGQKKISEIKKKEKRENSCKQIFNLWKF